MEYRSAVCTKTLLVTGMGVLLSVESLEANGHTRRGV